MPVGGPVLRPDHVQADGRGGVRLGALLREVPAPREGHGLPGRDQRVRPARVLLGAVGRVPAGRAQEERGAVRPEHRLLLQRLLSHAAGAVRADLGLRRRRGRRALLRPVQPAGLHQRPLRLRRQGPLPQVRPREREMWGAAVPAGQSVPGREGV